MNNIYYGKRFELTVNAGVTHVRFTYDDGSFDTVYPFQKQPIKVTYDDEGLETVEKDGGTVSCVRYTPIKIGKLTVGMYEGDSLAKTWQTEVLPSDSHGYIRVSEKDSRYFEYSDGTPFVPVGINMVYPTSYTVSAGTEFGVTKLTRYIGLRQYRAWFKKASENGVNMVRLWCGHEYFNPDTKNAYELDLVKFSIIDKVVELAEEYGITLKLTFEQFRYFRYDSPVITDEYTALIRGLFNKHLYLDGKRCENMAEWLTHKKWHDAWLYKVNEFAKRYSGSTAVFAVEPWNEMNCIGSFDEMVEWNKMMLPKLKELFPHNMVTNSFGSMGDDIAKDLYNAFCWDKCDFKQIHQYLDQGAGYKCCGENPVEFVKHSFELMKTKSQPLMLAETGAVDKCHSGPFKYYSADDDGLIFADCVYTPFFVGSGGCGQIWHWNGRYVESKSLYKMYKPFSELIQGIDIASEAFEAQDLSTDKAYVLILKGKEHILGYVRNKSSDWRYTLRELRAVEDIPELKLCIGGTDDITLIKIWNDNSSIDTADDGIVVKNVHHGLFFRLKK